ncbi:hypothetical protein F2Q68_00003160 [Brassica cretica]|uniref:Uncharacterized protein n=1 Tax=Brassica cretica TaxID=69181 RepID=A0A8S9JGN1_BRACR|nr:hypothetical protein F2Q68_00003160 [Brassica cretica]
MASIIPFTFREAVDDVEYKGYLIPKGWKVMPLFRNIHHNPKYFSNPEVFDPSRFEDDKGRVLTQEQSADNIIGVLFAAQDTTASCLTWILKYLHDDQKLLEDVKDEHRATYKENSREKKSLTWGQTRNMPQTHKVILESLRMASIIPFTFREAVDDVEYKGYLIPKGWKVMPLFRNIHHNPKYFSNPEVFDPSRFEPNTFMPFGSGVHACPGNELAKLQILIFLHHLVSKFRLCSSSVIQIDPWSIGSQRKLEVLVIRRASADILCLRTTEGCWSPPVSHRDLAFHDGSGGGVRRRRVFLEDGGSYGL